MIRQAVAPALVMLALVAGPALAQQGAPKAISCDGVFARNSDHNRLVKAFGAANVRYTKVQDSAGERVAASVVYPNNHARRLEFVWTNVKARRGPSLVVYHHTSTWKLSNGIGIGTTMDQVIAINGKPVSFYGFGWEMSGATTDFHEGTMAKPAGGCNISLSFGPGIELPGETYAAVSGEGTFSSDDEKIKAVKPVVTRFEITWPPAD